MVDGQENVEVKGMKDVSWEDAVRESREYLSNLLLKTPDGSDVALLSQPQQLEDGSIAMVVGSSFDLKADDKVVVYLVQPQVATAGSVFPELNGGLVTPNGAGGLVDQHGNPL